MRPVHSTEAPSSVPKCYRQCSNQGGVTVGSSQIQGEFQPDFHRNRSNKHLNPAFQRRVPRADHGNPCTRRTSAPSSERYSDPLYSPASRESCGGRCIPAAHDSIHTYRHQSGYAPGCIQPCTVSTVYCAGTISPILAPCLSSLGGKCRT